LVIKRVQKAGDRLDLMGDNRAQSTDSRAFGSVPKSAILGVVMSIFPARATDAPRPKNIQLLVVSYAAAALLLGMAVAQLVTFDKFLPLVQDAYLSGERPPAQLIVAVIVASEVFALPFLLRLRLSPLARISSVGCGFLAAGTWLMLQVTQLIEGVSTTSTGIFGTLVRAPYSMTLIVLLALFGLLIASYFILDARAAFAAAKGRLKSSH